MFCDVAVFDLINRAEMHGAFSCQGAQPDPLCTDDGHVKPGSPGNFVFLVFLADANRVILLCHFVFFAAVTL